MTTTANLTDTQPTPADIGEQLLQLMRAANTCPNQVIARDPGVYGHLRAALAELLHTQGWGARQADEAITEVMQDPLATLRETMLALQAPVVTAAMAEQVRVAACKQLGITPDSGLGPRLLPEWDDPGRQWVITWPGIDWADMFPCGGRNADGIELPEAVLPAGVWVEQISSYAVAVYPR